MSYATSASLDYFVAILSVVNGIACLAWSALLVYGCRSADQEDGRLPVSHASDSASRDRSTDDARID